jgi:predicted nucleic acid-binding protein
MLYVLDCSFCAALLLPDEKSEKVERCFLKIKDSDDIFIPHLWWYEMSNVLRNTVKRNRLTYNEIFNINQLLSEYNFITDSNLGNKYTRTLLELAQTYDLSAYDSVYLELGIRKQGIVGTLDDNLQKACTKAGINTL